MPQQNHLAHPLLNLCNEVGQRCTDADLPQPSRNTVAEQWALYRDEQQALLANDPKSQKAPGNFNVKSVLDIVQIDHTQADAFVVDLWFRRSMGRPWLTLAIDIASRWWPTSKSRYRTRSGIGSAKICRPVRCMELTFELSQALV